MSLSPWHICFEFSCCKKELAWGMELISCSVFLGKKCSFGKWNDWCGQDHGGEGLSVGLYLSGPASGLPGPSASCPCFLQCGFSTASGSDLPDRTNPSTSIHWWQALIHNHVPQPQKSWEQTGEQAACTGTGWSPARWFQSTQSSRCPLPRHVTFTGGSMSYLIDYLFP